MFKKLGLITMCFVFTASLAMASPVNLPTDIKGQDGMKLISNLPVGISAGYVFDYVSKRKLTKDSGSADFYTNGGKIDLTILNNFDIYTVLGGVQSPELKGNYSDSDVKISLNDSFIWEVGASAILYQWKDQGIQIFGDGNYRQSNGLDIDSVTVDGTTYSKSQFQGVTASVKWQEWQTALGVSKKFEYFIPYGGVVYSDVKASAKVKISGTTYDSGSVSSHTKVGPFVGVSILPTKWLSIDVTGRFVAEEAVSVGVNIKF